MRNQIIDILENNLHAGDTPVSGISEAADEIVQFFGGDAGMQEQDHNRCHAPGSGRNSKNR